MTKLFTITEHKPKIFLMKFKHQYDMCMHFLRFSEFVETPSKDFKGKPFKILDFMRWYALNQGGGIFSYPEDWGGFNCTSESIQRTIDAGIVDFNDYDQTMVGIYNDCKTKYDKFALIGTSGHGQSTKHEVAHGIFYINDEYREKAIELVASLPKEVSKKINCTLKKMGYNVDVLVDETNAYLSTGYISLCEWDNELQYDLIKLSKPFTNLYKEYSKKV